jgi:hypothetical protein
MILGDRIANTHASRSTTAHRSTTNPEESTMLTATTQAKGMILSLASAYKPSWHRRRPSAGRNAIRPQVLGLEYRLLLTQLPAAAYVTIDATDPTGKVSASLGDDITGYIAPTGAPLGATSYRYNNVQINITNEIQMDPGQVTAAFDYYDPTFPHVSGEPIYFNIYEPGVPVVKNRSNGLDATLEVTLTEDRWSMNAEEVGVNFTFMSDTGHLSGCFGPGPSSLKPYNAAIATNLTASTIDQDLSAAIAQATNTPQGAQASNFHLQIASGSSERSLPVYGTGLSTSGALLSITPPNLAGTMPADPHYTVFPAGGTQTPAFTVNSSALAGPLRAYVPDGPNSEWISPDKTGNAVPVSPVLSRSGFYDYETTFDLTGENASTAELMGDWAVDNEGTIWLNGQPVDASSGGVIGTNTAVSFDTLHNFTITDSSGVKFRRRSRPDLVLFAMISLQQCHDGSPTAPTGYLGDPHT